MFVCIYVNRPQNKMYFLLHKHYFNQMCFSFFTKVMTSSEYWRGSLLLYKVIFRKFIINKNTSIEYFFIFELFYFWKNVYNLKVWLIFKRVYNLILSKWHFDSAHCFVFSSGFPVFSPSILHSICSAAWQNAIIQISVYPSTQTSKQMFSTSHCAIKLYKI